MSTGDQGDAQKPKTYTFAQVCKMTGKSKSTLVRWEERGIFPPPKRRASTKARIFTDEHVQKIREYDAREEDPPARPASKGGKR
jgi:predicted DNA-binding transcriptional regulator AlpA